VGATPKETDAMTTDTMQTMKLANDLIGPLLTGEKRGTVRAGIRDVKLEPLRLEPASGHGFAYVVEVLEVRYKLAGDLTDEEGRRDGYANGFELFQALLKYYPDLGRGSPVTVVYFGLILDVVEMPRG
jgi:hypothetical protein